MSVSRRRWFISVLFAAAILAVSALARAEPPAYTLEVDSDAPDIIGYEALAGPIASELGGAVDRPSGTSPTRAAITVRYHGGTISVRALRSGGPALEREVRAEGDAAAVRHEAILLVGNVARDESREILDALAARHVEPPEPPPPPPKPAPEAPPEERRVATVAFVYPLATNIGRPDVRTPLAFALLYGRVGRVDALDLGGVVAHTSRAVSGVQLAGVVAITNGDVRGVQISAATNIASRSIAGVQGSVVNVSGSVEGVQIGLVNVAGRVKGAQVGLVNVAAEVDGASIGLVSIARDMIHPVVWVSNTTYTNAGVKFTAKYLYTVTAIGAGTRETGFRASWPSFTVALGGHVPVVRGLDVDVETAYSHQELDAPLNSNSALHVRALPGYTFAKHLRVFVGGGVRVPIAFGEGRPVVRPEAAAGVQF